MAESVRLLARVLERLPEDHPHYPDCLYGFARVLVSTAEERGEDQPLDDAISLLTRLVSDPGDVAADYPAYRDALGSALVLRFDRFHHAEDLVAAVDNAREAVRAE